MYKIDKMVIYYILIQITRYYIIFSKNRFRTVGPNLILHNLLDYKHFQTYCNL